MTAIADTVIGTRLALAEQIVTRLDLAAYCLGSGDHNPIHWSDEAALAAGLPGVIAHGMLTMGLVSKAVLDWGGNDTRVTDMSVRFARPLIVPSTVAGVTVQIFATVLDRSDEHVEFELEVATCDGTTLLTSSRATLRRQGA